MSQEVNSVIFKLKLLEDISHGLLAYVNVFPSLRVVEVEVLHVKVKVPAAFLLPEAHERALQSF